MNLLKMISGTYLSQILSEIIKRLFGIYPPAFLCVFLAISSLFFRSVAMAMRLKNASICQKIHHNNPESFRD